MVAAAGLVASVVAAFYYLRIIKLMWFDAAPEGTAATDKAPVEAQWIGWACAAFSFPLVIVALTWLEPLTPHGRRRFRSRLGRWPAAPILLLDETDSTNAEARRRAEAGETGPLWIVARRQTAGRGRRGRAWDSEHGQPVRHPADR